VGNARVFEVSFEVCNKVGGIYTVLASKAAQMIKMYNDKYTAVGFYDPEKSKFEIELRDPGELREIFEELNKEGIKCYYGQWRIEGKPRVILLDVKNCMHRKNEIKTKLWEDFGIDSIKAGCDFDEPVVWAWAVGRLLEMLIGHFKDDDIVCQFHEWLSGAALLYLKQKNTKAGLVFTTHATVLGRTMAGHGENLIEQIDDGIKNGKTVDEKKAYNYKVNAKHLLEKKSAEEADVFTTVSKTMARETQFILGKAPDKLLLNGLDMEKFPAMEELSYLHKKYKKKLVEFLQAYFTPYYRINTNDPRIIFISGRYEFKNKGLDVLIEALGKANQKLKETGVKRDTFVFFFIPSNVRGEKFEVLENISLYNELEDHVEEMLPEIKDEMLNILMNTENVKKLSKVLKKFLADSEKLSDALKSKRAGHPPLCTYDLNYNEDDDLIIKALRANNLLNKEDDPIKVIFYPVYLSITDKLLSMDYYQTVIGSSFGVFPSYYEPWGYTPLETAANGALSLTTDFGGFGQFIMETMKKSDGKKHGIMVLKARGRDKKDVVQELCDYICWVAKMSVKEIVEMKMDAKRLASEADWENLAKLYIEAHNLALEKMRRRCS